MEDMEKEMEHSPECDARCLMDAEMIKKDPERLAAAMELLTNQKKAITSLESLKKVASSRIQELNKKESPEAEEED